MHIFHHKVNDQTAEYGFTEFSDMTPEEFETQFLTMNLGENIRLSSTMEENLERKRKSKYDTSKLPTSYDWREKGVITRVKQQSTCGSCWTFSTTGVMEAQYAIKTGKLVEFSEQMLLDCDDRNDGCSGGLMHKAYKSIKDWGGLELA
jgi:cathepsin F